MTQRLAATFLVLLAAAFCTAAMADSIPFDPTLKIINGGHSTDVNHRFFGPFFPFAGASAGAECLLVTGDAFCSFKNNTASGSDEGEGDLEGAADKDEGIPFNRIAITITGESNPITCFNLINPGAGCRVSGDTITFFDLGIPAEPGEWTWDFENTFNPAISASFEASDLTAICKGPGCTFGVPVPVPEPASALLLGTGLGALLALTRRWNLRRSKT
jgi:hypothetical protein